jgi:hypothetical protein
MHVSEMIGTHPDVKGNVNQELLTAIEACYDCAQTCTSCADACLAEAAVADLRQCIRLNADCADICAAAGAMLGRRTGSNERLIAQVLQACITACAACAEECERHAAMHGHCRVCAEACRWCERACQGAAGTITPA